MAKLASKSVSTRTQKIRISKQDIIIRLLRRGKGATLVELTKATDWQEHSIRGFFSGTLRKKLALNIESKKCGKGFRRYRIVEIEPTSQAGEAA